MFIILLLSVLVKRFLLIWSFLVYHERDGATRKELFERRKAAVEEEINALEKTLAMLKFKCWYYEKAMADGNEDKINEMMPDKFPPDIQELYDRAHAN